MIKKQGLKQASFFYWLMLCINIQLTSQDIEIPFEGNEVHIIGTMESLYVEGTDAKKASLQNHGGANNNYADYVVDGNVLKLAFTDQANNIALEIPKSTNLKIHPVPIVFEGGKYERGNYIDLVIEEMQGEIEINADGFNVSLEDVSGPVSVVTYGNIESTLSNPSSNKLVSLDTYHGNIDVRIPSSPKVQLQCSAENGTVNIDKSIQQTQEKNQAQIILHTERGAYVNVKKIELTIDPTHPELRDKLIKIFIEDQGKNRMDNKARRNLEAMGYATHISA